MIFKIDTKIQQNVVIFHVQPKYFYSDKIRWTVTLYNVYNETRTNWEELYVINLFSNKKQEDLS